MDLGDHVEENVAKSDEANKDLETEAEVVSAPAAGEQQLIDTGVNDTAEENQNSDVSADKTVESIDTPIDNAVAEEKVKPLSDEPDANGDDNGDNLQPVSDLLISVTDDSTNPEEASTDNDVLVSFDNSADNLLVVEENNMEQSLKASDNLLSISDDFSADGNNGADGNLLEPSSDSTRSSKEEVVSTENSKSSEDLMNSYVQVQVDDADLLQSVDDSPNEEADEHGDEVKSNDISPVDKAAPFVEMNDNGVTEKTADVLAEETLLSETDQKDASVQQPAADMPSVESQALVSFDDSPLPLVTVDEHSEDVETPVEIQLPESSEHTDESIKETPPSEVNEQPTEEAVVVADKNDTEVSPNPQDEEEVELPELPKEPTQPIVADAVTEKAEDLYTDTVDGGDFLSDVPEEVEPISLPVISAASNTSVQSPILSIPVITIEEAPPIDFSESDFEKTDDTRTIMSTETGFFSGEESPASPLPLSTGESFSSTDNQSAEVASKDIPEPEESQIETPPPPVVGGDVTTEDPLNEMPKEEPPEIVSPPVTASDDDDRNDYSSGSKDESLLEATRAFGLGESERQTSHEQVQINVESSVEEPPPITEAPEYREEVNVTMMLNSRSVAAAEVVKENLPVVSQLQPAQHVDLNATVRLSDVSNQSVESVISTSDEAPPPIPETTEVVPAPEKVEEKPAVTPILSEDESPNFEDSPQPLVNEDDRDRWLKVTGSRDFMVDLKAIAPYKKFISFGGFTEKKEAIIVLTAAYLPAPSEQNYNYLLNHLFHYLVNAIDLLAPNEYVVVYFHCFRSSGDMPPLAFCSSCYGQLDIRLRKSAKAIYVVHANGWVKTAAAYLSAFKQFARRKLNYVQNLVGLKALIPTEYMFIPDEVVDADRNVGKGIGIFN